MCDGCRYVWVVRSCFWGLCFGLWEQVVGCFVWPLVVGVVWAGGVGHLALCVFFCFLFWRPTYDGAHDL